MSNERRTKEQDKIITEIGRAILSAPLPKELQEVAPKTNNIFLTQEQCQPFRHKDADGKETTYGIREQEELYCLHCNSIFPAAWLKIDQFGNRAGCGSKGKPDCNGAGIGIDLYNAASEASLCCLHQWNSSPQEARQKGYIGVEIK